MKTVLQKIVKGHYNSKLHDVCRTITCSKCHYKSVNTIHDFCPRCGNYMPEYLKHKAYMADQTKLYNKFIKDAFKEYGLSNHRNLESLEYYIVRSADHYTERHDVENIESIYNAIRTFAEILSGFKYNKKEN